jgi:serine/threonine-protein kinase
MMPPSGEFRAARPVSGPPSGPVPQTAATWGNTRASVRPRGAAPVAWIVSGLLVVVVAGAGALVLVKRGASRAPAEVTGVAAAGVASTGSPGPAPSAVQPAATAELAAPVAEPTATEPPPVVSASTAVRNGKPAPTHVVAGGNAPGTATPASKPAANCDPPYTLDDQGRKHFKAECYLKSP